MARDEISSQQHSNNFKISKNCEKYMAQGYLKTFYTSLFRFEFLQKKTGNPQTLS